MRLLLVVAIASGCSAPEVQDAPADAAIDTGIYVYPDAVGTIDDAVVHGHDEDGDHVIDEVDNCPQIANEAENKVFTPFGQACRPIAPFDDVDQRIFFDAFTRARPAWTMSGGEGAFAFRDSLPDLMAGGSELLYHRVAYTQNVVPPGKAVVVTAVMQTVQDSGDGTAVGVLARASSDGKSYIGCNRFNLWVTPNGGCPAADDCPIAAVATGTWPEELLTVPVYGLRLSIRNNDDGSVLAECRMFDPKQVATLTGQVRRYAITHTFAAGSVNADGQAGVFAHHGGVYVYSFEIATSK